jgi:hypothetical protein
MADKIKAYDNFPTSIVLTVNLLFVLFYLAGAYIMFSLHPITGSLYLIYLIVLEFSIYREGCRYCFYYDKQCAFGRGKFAKLFYKKDKI